MSDKEGITFHGTTIIAVRKDGKVAIGGDGQVTMGNTVMKHGAKKVRRLHNDKVIAGFAGSTADAFTLFEFRRVRPTHHYIDSFDAWDAPYDL